MDSKWEMDYRIDQRLFALLQGFIYTRFLLLYERGIFLGSSLSCLFLLPLSSLASQYIERMSLT